MNLAFVHTQGDIDLEILNASQARLGISDSTSNSEQVSLQVTAGQTYYIWVYGYHGATNSNYSMAIDVPTACRDTARRVRGERYRCHGTQPRGARSGLRQPEHRQDGRRRLLQDCAGRIGDVELESVVPELSGQCRHANPRLVQVQLGLSASTANSEQLSVPVTAGQTYYVRVYGFQGAVNANYTMTVDVPSASGITPDTLEDNDTMATVRSLSAVSQTFQNLSIDASGDDDFYKIVPTVTGSHSFSLAFVHASGDIDMEVLNSTGTRLGRSESTTNSEQLSLTLTAGQTYYVRVYGYHGAVNPNYSMTIGVPSPVQSSVTYLSTAESGTLTSTDGSPSLTFADSDIVKLSRAIEWDLWISDAVRWQRRRADDDQRGYRCVRVSSGWEHCDIDSRRLLGAGRGGSHDHRQR